MRRAVGAWCGAVARRTAGTAETRTNPRDATVLETTTFPSFPKKVSPFDDSRLTTTARRARGRQRRRRRPAGRLREGAGSAIHKTKRRLRSRQREGATTGSTAGGAEMPNGSVRGAVSRRTDARRKALVAVVGHQRRSAAACDGCSRLQRRRRERTVAASPAVPPAAPAVPPAVPPAALPEPAGRSDNVVTKLLLSVHTAVVLVLGCSNNTSCRRRRLLLGRALLSGGRESGYEGGHIQRRVHRRH